MALPSTVDTNTITKDNTYWKSTQTKREKRISRKVDILYIVVVTAIGDINENVNHETELLIRGLNKDTEVISN